MNKKLLSLTLIAGLFNNMILGLSQDDIMKKLHKHYTVENLEKLSQKIKHYDEYVKCMTKVDSLSFGIEEICQTAALFERVKHGDKNPLNPAMLEWLKSRFNKSRENYIKEFDQKLKIRGLECYMDKIDGFKLGLNEEPIEIKLTNGTTLTSSDSEFSVYKQLAELHQEFRLVTSKDANDQIYITKINSAYNLNMANLFPDNIIIHMMIDNPAFFTDSITCMKKSEISQKEIDKMISFVEEYKKTHQS